jgi:hypothetical protein
MRPWASTAAFKAAAHDLSWASGRVSRECIEEQEAECSTPKPFG